MITNTMPSEWLTAIEAAFPGVVISEVRTTFQNCLAKAHIGDTSVYIKTYSSDEHYQTELRVLAGLKSLSPTFIRYPLLLEYREQIQAIVMSEVSGRQVTITNTDAELVAIANALKNFHTLPGIPNLDEVDIAARIKRYQENILCSAHLNAAEKRIARRALAILAATIPHSLEAKQLVHGDLNAGNILYDATNEVPLVFIDFERSSLGCGIADIAKLVWRLLQSDIPLAHEFLSLYLRKIPTTTDKKKLYWYMLFEYFGAISYFAYRGYKENYPYKDPAFNHLEACLALL